jgi:hypothetical protein
MFILPKEEFVEELKAEMAGYEEITIDLINNWMQHFEAYVSRKNINNKRISFRSGKLYITLQDESDLFKIVDKYFAAIENEELEAYWADWSL